MPSKYRDDVEGEIEEKATLLHSSTDALPSQPSLRRRQDRKHGAFIAAAAGLLGLFTGVLLTYLLLTLLGRHQLQRLPLRAITDVDQTFSKRPVYGDPPSPASNKAWAAMIPKGRGFVKVNATSRVPYSTLDPSTVAANGSIYCLSVFHQLHCLDMLRRGYYAAVGVSGKESDTGEHMHGDVHMIHCFDYLRQSIACAADTTLEPRDEEHSAVQGWGVTHQCRNFNAVKEWAEEWRSNDNGGIAN